MEYVEIRKKLVDKWGAEGLWIPLNGEKASETVDYFEYDNFQSVFGITKLSKMVEELQPDVIYEISEVGEDRIIAASEIDEYGGIEMFYTDSEANWLIYLSHENTITIAGASLLNAIKSNRSNWSDYNKPWER
ncbi:hypothetical protein [Botryobacter ruber]|uniref:hypothetical protein n=1 Tax=Botryobacter ruber TaxID=2171629 RepID=UPI000F6550B1|nr:hypothetical protein [Botryobacter ruber]